MRGSDDRRPDTRTAPLVLTVYMEGKMEYRIKQYNTPNLPCYYYVADMDGNKVTDQTPNIRTAEMMLMVQQQVNDSKYRTHEECRKIWSIR